MKKTYWWRYSLIIIALGYLLWAYFVPCELKFGRCVGGNSIPVVRSFFHFSLALLVVAPSLFFIKDVILLKWLRFSIVWFTVSAIAIISVPEYATGWLVSGPEKESVSIWMSSLFVIISLAKLAWDSRKKV